MISAEADGALNEAGAGNLCSFVYRSAQEKPALERVAGKDKVGRERVSQHRDDPE